MTKPIEWSPAREQLVDARGRLLTLGLFLEIDYNNKDAIYTLKDYDHEYEGKTYLSLKRLFLEASDPTEYMFATKYLAGWEHWQRINANKALALYTVKWRQELELKLRAEGVQHVLKSARVKQNWLAAKFLAEKGWEVRAAGRPSQDEVDKNLAIESKIQNEFSEDIARLRLVNG